MLSRVKHLNVFLKDPDKKPFLKMFVEIIHFAILKKMWPTDYFRKFLYRKDVIDYKNYLSLKEYYAIINSNKISVPEIKSILNNKLSFALFAERNQLPVPKLLGYNFKSFFYLKDTVSIITTKEQLFHFFNALFTAVHVERIFLKPIEGFGGVGCVLLEKDKLKEQIAYHEATLLQNSYLYQDVVRQHPTISKVNPNSVNTLRIDTYVDQNQEVHVLSALMRFGIGESIVDNAHSGGFCVSVNIEKGELQSKGRQDVVEGGRAFLKHPDTDIELDGYKIPFIKEACHLAKLATKKLPNGIIGWDIAITETGPILIEGNKFPSLHVTDLAYGGYLKNKHIQDALKQLKA